MIGKIIYLDYLINKLNLELKDTNFILNDTIKKYNTKLNDYIEISNKVYNENQENINDFKTIFNSAYNSSYKIVKETFKNENNISFNKGFYLDKEKEAIYFNVDDKQEILEDRVVTTDNEIVFFFDNDIELNLIQAIIKDNDGINISPKEIIINNTLGNSFFLEDFNRFFEIKENEYDIQTFISNSKKTNTIKFVFDKTPNYALSTFKFFYCTYETDNEIIIKYSNEFKKNKLIKLQRRIYDKYKMLKYYISFDDINYKEFNWTDPELEKMDIEDDVKIITLPEKTSDNIFIKLVSDKNIKIETNTIVKTENYIEQIVPRNYISNDSENFYTYPINNYGGKINKQSIKIYLSNKYSDIILKHKPELIDKVTEKNKNLIANGYINIENPKLERDDLFYLMDFDSLESLEVLENELGFFINDNLYLPSVFYEENIYFRVSYDVEFSEDTNNINYYTPFVFDFNIMGGD